MLTFLELDMQKKQRLSGDIEADGTGLRNWKHGDRIFANMYTRQSIHSINSSCFFESSLFRINTKKRLGRFEKTDFSSLCICRTTLRYVLVSAFRFSSKR